jgi:hypothetical protein
MTTIAEIEAAILKLPKEDLRRLAEWFHELDQAAWDQQIERDAQAGKLDRLAEQALNDHRSGKTNVLCNFTGSHS